MRVQKWTNPDGDSPLEQEMISEAVLSIIESEVKEALTDGK